MPRSVTITWRPLTQWPVGRARTPEWQREDAKFARGEWRESTPGFPSQGSRLTRTRTPLSTTLKDIDRELSAIRAYNIVVQVDVRSERDFRVDGTGPRADARLGATPGVVLTFTSKRVVHVFAADFFKRWEDNLRAIALGLDGLRRMERYHITQAGEQYRGWQALPASTTPTLSTEEAARALARRSSGAVVDDSVVLDFAAGIQRSLDIARKAYRQAAYVTHPDRGGLVADFQLVQEAKRILEQHHGGTL